MPVLDSTVSFLDYLYARDVVLVDTCDIGIAS
jgi:hypothetical protein